MTEEEKRWNSLVDLLRKKIKPSTPLKDVIPIIPEYISGIEQTKDIYFDLPKFCALVFKESLSSKEEFTLSQMRAVTYAVSCLFNWGIYPHLPKSVQIPFMDKEHWVYSPAPPRFFTPDPDFIDALLIFFNTISCAKVHPLFLQHMISILHFLDKEKLPGLIRGQETQALFTSVIALIPKKIQVSYLLTDIVLNRSDALESLQETVFPAPALARAIGTPPNIEKQDEYFSQLFPKLFEATRSGRGAVLSREIIHFIVCKRPEQFLKNCDLSPILNWPSEQSISGLLWTLKSIMVVKMASQVLISPMPFRFLFIAALTEGEVHENAMKLVSYSISEEEKAAEFFKVITADSNLLALDLDSYGIEVRENGVFVIEQEHDEEEQLDIIQKMRELAAKLVNVEFMPYIVERLPGTFGSIQLVSLVLQNVKKIDNKLGIPILSFLANVQGDEDIGIDIIKIAKTIFYNLTEVTQLPRKVIETFGADIVEMLSMDAIGDDEDDNEDGPYTINLLKNDLNSPIPALRARGLFELRRGIMDKNSPLRNEDEIKKIFPLIEKQLKHGDSFVYINGIQTLETIGDVFPHLVVEKLTEQFPQKDVAISLKISQALMLLSRRCGPGMVNSPSGNLCGFYIKAYARGAEHESPLIQAASLSDLAEFIQSVQFGCVNWLTDIVITIDNSWQSHHVIDVRRAASYLCYKMILVLGEGFGECSPEDVKYLGRVVKRNREAELDDIAHQNAEDCFQTMWDCAAKYL